MAESEAVFGDVEQAIEHIGAADVVVGIATYDNLATIEGVLDAVLAGLDRLSPRRAALVHADGGSRDGVPERVRELVGTRFPLVQVAYPVYPVHKLSAPPGSVPGKGEALRAILGVAGRLSPAACAVVDANLRSMAPEWVELLVRPVLEEGFDFVVSRHQRRRFESAINSGIVYPLTRALYGRRIRQPLGGDHAFSAKFMEHCAAGGFREGETPFGADLWLALEAVSRGFRICQASLGARVVHAGDGAPELSTTLAQVLASLFDAMNGNPAVWQRVKGSEPVPVFGQTPETAEEAAPVNARRMAESFRLGHGDLQEIWHLVLPPATLLEFKRLARRPDEEFRLPDEVWARTVYDFSLGYRLRVIDRSHLLRAMTPIYLGWLASFAGEMQNAGPAALEERLERLCLAFETEKRYLISRWRWPDRFNP
jgi:glucosylglycerate synthase